MAIEYRKLTEKELDTFIDMNGFVYDMSHVTILLRKSRKYVINNNMANDN